MWLCLHIRMKSKALKLTTYWGVYLVQFSPKEVAQKSTEFYLYPSWVWFHEIFAQFHSVEILKKFLSLIFYVISILENPEVLKLLFLPFFSLQKVQKFIKIKISEIWCGFKMLQFCTLGTLFHEFFHNFMIINFHDFV